MFQNGKGLFGGNPMAMQQEAQKAPRQGGIGGFLSRNQMPLAQIADTLLRYSGSGGSPVLARMQQQQDLQQVQGFRTQLAKQQQDAEQRQWIARQAWERANPPPQEPTALQRNYEWLQQTNPGVAQDYLAAQARDPNDETVSVTIPNVGTYVGPRSGMAQAFGGQSGGNRPAIGSTIRLDGSTAPQGAAPQMSAGNGPPSPTTTPEGLGAMIAAHGHAAVQRWMQSGQLTIRNN